MVLSFDDLFGLFNTGKAYQIGITICGCILYGWSIPSVSINYVAAPMDHWCDLSSYMGTNMSIEELKKIHIPLNPDGTMDQCHMFSEPVVGANFTVAHANLTKCTSWTYNRSQFESSAVSQYDLVCDNDWLVALSSSLYLTGVAIGSLIAGFISDRIGRLKTCFIFLFLQAGGGVASAFLPSYLLFAIFRVIIGFGNAGALIAAYVLMIEEVCPQWRSTVGVLFQMSYTMGFIMMTGVAYLIRDNTYFQLSLALPSFAYFLMFGCLCVESPRWLLAVGKQKEARKALGRVFGSKCKDQIDRLDLVTVDVQDKKSQKGNWLDLFKYSSVRTRTLIIHYQWFAVSIVWYALSLNSSSIPGNIFVVTLFLAVVEIPAGLLCMFLCHWKVTGRKYSSILSLATAGVCGFICVPFLHKGYHVAVMVISFIGKCFISMAWTCLFVHSVELFPTDVRNAATGSCCFCSYLSGMIGAFVGGPLGKIWTSLPFVIYGVLGVSAAVMGKWLPETRGEDLCDTVAEVVGRKKFEEKDENILPSNEFQTFDKLTTRVHEELSLILPTPGDSVIA